MVDNFRLRDDLVHDDSNLHLSTCIANTSDHLCLQMQKSERRYMRQQLQSRFNAPSISVTTQKATAGPLNTYIALEWHHAWLTEYSSAQLAEGPKEKSLLSAVQIQSLISDLLTNIDGIGNWRHYSDVVVEECVLAKLIFENVMEDLVTQFAWDAE
jgi:hypothetical protein